MFRPTLQTGTHCCEVLLNRGTSLATLRPGRRGDCCPSEEALRVRTRSRADV